MSEVSKKYYKAPTLCWDCKKAVLGCSWSREFIPVKGWLAFQTHKGEEGRPDHDSYHVANCPEFERDAVCGGQRRWKDEQLI